MMDTRLFTIGHSNRTIEEFLSLLTAFGITAVADVRSSPFSRRYPQFNRDVLTERLRQHGVEYVFLGEELGARRSEPECYDGNCARYELIAQAPRFQHGLDRIRAGLKTHRIAMMCAEKDPLSCHRSILLCRHLKAEFPIEHILDPGQSESHADAERRLLKLLGRAPNNLFFSMDELIDDAYTIQGDKIAYRTPTVAHSAAGSD